MLLNPISVQLLMLDQSQGGGGMTFPKIPIVIEELHSVTPSHDLGTVFSHSNDIINAQGDQYVSFYKVSY